MGFVSVALLDIIPQCPAGSSADLAPERQKKKSKKRLIQKKYLKPASPSIPLERAEGWMLRLCSGFHEWMNVETQEGIWRGFGSLLQDLSGTQSIYNTSSIIIT